MEFKDETEELLEFYKSLSKKQAKQFVRVLGGVNIYGEQFVQGCINTLLIHELKLPPKEKD